MVVVLGDEPVGVSIDMRGSATTRTVLLIGLNEPLSGTARKDNDLVEARTEAADRQPIG